MDMYDQLVARGLQGNIAVQRNFIGHEHILPAVHPFSVDIGIENRVDSLKRQHGKLIFRYGRQIKDRTVKQMPILQLTELGNIRPPVRILQKPRPHHVQLKIAGDNGGDGYAEIGREMKGTLYGGITGGGTVFLVGDDGQGPILQFNSHINVLSLLIRMKTESIYKHYTTKAGVWQVGCTKKTKIYSTFLCKTA
jgi:hypothetical protein